MLQFSDLGRTNEDKEVGEKKVRSAEGEWKVVATPKQEDKELSTARVRVRDIIGGGGGEDEGDKDMIIARAYVAGDLKFESRTRSDAHDHNHIATANMAGVDKNEDGVWSHRSF